MRLLACCLLVGCIWDPQSYRGRDAETDSSVDSSTDAQVDLDGGVDSDAMLDAEDIDNDAGDSGDPCYEESDPVVLRESTTFSNKRIVVEDDSVPAIEIQGRDVLVQNVEIILRGDSPGIVISAPEVRIFNVRIVNDNADNESIAIESQSDGTTELFDLTFSDIEVEGMLAIQLSNVASSNFNSIRVLGPTTPLIEEAKRVAIACDNCQRVEFDGVTIEAGTNLHHALRVRGERVMLANLRLGTATEDFPLLGITTGSDLSTLVDSYVYDAARGIQLRGPGGWSVTNVHVERTNDCDPDDFAFDAHNASAGSRACNDCTYHGDPCTREGTSPMPPPEWTVRRDTRRLDELPVPMLCER